MSLSEFIRQCPHCFADDLQMVDNPDGLNRLFQKPPSCFCGQINRCANKFLQFHEQATYI